MKVELRKVKVYDEMSRETTAFNAELWIDGKLAATCMNDGGGGDHMIHYVDRHHGQSAYETAFDAWTKAMPPVPCEDDWAIERGRPPGNGRRPVDWRRGGAHSPRKTIASELWAQHLDTARRRRP